MESALVWIVTGNTAKVSKFPVTHLGTLAQKRGSNPERVGREMAVGSLRIVNIRFGNPPPEPFEEHLK